MSKLHEKPKALKIEYPVLQKWSLLPVTFLWVIFVLLDLDLDQCLIIKEETSEADPYSWNPQAFMYEFQV